MSGFIGSSKIASSGTPSLLSSGSSLISSGVITSSGSSGSQPSGSSLVGSVEFVVTNMHAVDTSMGSPSNGDFIIENVGSIGGTITAISGTAVGFVVFPASPLPAHLGVGDTLYVFCSTNPTEVLIGTGLTIDYLGDDGEVGQLNLVWTA